MASIRSKYSLSIFCTLAVGLSAITSGCTSIVDSPATPPVQVNTVRSVYWPLADTGRNFIYSIRDSDLDRHLVQRDSVQAQMRGKLDPHSLPPSFVLPHGTETFHTTYPRLRNHPMNIAGDTIFAINDSEVYNLSYVSDGHDSHLQQWLDLKLPIALNASWKFQWGDPGDSIVAKVTLTDFSVALEGNSYSHVTEVTYYPVHGMNGNQMNDPLVVHWFAKDLGLIRSISYQDHHKIDRRLVGHF